MHRRQTRSPGSLRVAPSLESLEERCTPTFGLQLPSALASPLEAPLPLAMIVPSLSAASAPGSEIGAGPIAALSLQAPLSLPIAPLLSAAIDVAAPTVALAVDAGPITSPHLNLAPAGTGGSALLGLNPHVGVESTPLLDTSLQVGPGEGGSAATGLGLAGLGNSPLPVVAHVDITEPTPVGIATQPHSGGDASRSGVAQNTGNGDNIPAGKPPVSGPVSHTVGNGSVAVSPAVDSPGLDRNTPSGAVSKESSSTPGTVPPNPVGSTVLVIPSAVAIEVVNAIPSDRESAVTQIEGGSLAASPNPPALVLPVPTPPLPLASGATEDAIAVPAADMGELVTNFRLNDGSIAALDQLFGSANDDSGTGGWSLAWKLSPTVVLLLASAVELRRRRRRSADAVPQDQLALL